METFLCVIGFFFILLLVIGNNFVSTIFVAGIFLLSLTMAIKDELKRKKHKKEP